MRDYRSRHLVKYEAPPQRGYCSLPVLPFLSGTEWDDRALGLVHSLRPSAIRVVDQRGEQTCDAFPWRVTVILGPLGHISEITQEVEIGLAGTEWRHGHDAMCWLRDRGAIKR